MDKKNQVNEWIIARIPGVKESMTRYINAFWRPRHEQWEASKADGSNTLVQQWFFPPKYLQTIVSDSMRLRHDRMSRITKELLSRVGIAGPRAHPHAFRKGVVTELLRCDSPLKTVSLFVHHKNTQTTEQSYDKRKREEILEKMVVPVGWEELTDDIAEATMQEMDEPEAASTSSVTNSDTRERLALATRILEATESISKMQLKLELMSQIMSCEQLSRCVTATKKSECHPSDTSGIPIRL